ncbi:uncharacterized protein Z518_09330 [Rhinocladiella mackenziei CBS 650.93]|uniref:Uncharacterized protein n=1 Tax=Rhinocladiella mackenziei CBS 650.93 TaxID=1442369 RepID=A0A0D2I709_9EURO|nr:uncharacterized protein Z518_09330 [Rhinocladiella mackenziei CBS 650.93]KIX01604.1 hypothetical protein Z518_09330 [Rhinocladiella mackenziei CBS 650.93]
MSPNDSWADKLLEAARARNIIFSGSEIQEIRSANPKSLVASWIQENLVRSNPLSCEELALWQQLEDDAALRAVCKGTDSITIPSTDGEVQSAITALHASTRAIEKRMRILTAQNAHLIRPAASENASRIRKSCHAQHFSQKEAAEAQHVRFVNEQLFDTLRTDLQDERDNITRDIKSVTPIVTEVLNSDDRALAELDEPPSNTPKVTLDVDAIRDRVARLTAALRYFRTKAIKDSLDRTYLQNLDGNPGTVQPAQEVSAAMIKEIQDDLGSLYTEINDVVTMVVAQEYGNPIDATISRLERNLQQQNRELTEQIYRKLSSLTVSLETLSAKLENLQSQRLALHRLSSQTQTLESIILSRPKPSVVRSQAEDAQPSNPAAMALFQHLGLSTCMDSSTMTLNKQLDNLVAKLERRPREIVEQVVRNAEEAATKRRAVLQDVSKALATNSSHESEVCVLEQRITEARAELQYLGTSRQLAILPGSALSMARATIPVDLQCGSV